MVIAKEGPQNPLSVIPVRGSFGATNCTNQDQNSKITMTTASRNQMQDSNSSTWPTRRQSYGSQSSAQEATQNDWQTMIACDSSNWSSGQRFYTNQDHQRQTTQEEGNFHDYLPTKYLASNPSYSNETLRLVNYSTKIDEPNSRQTPYRVSVDNQHANHHHNYYNPITVNHVHVNYNASESYNPTNQHRIYHMDNACNRYQQGSIYAHDTHGCEQSGAILGGPVGGGDLPSTLSSPSSASLYHTQHGHQNYAAPMRAAGQPEVGRISFVESNKCWQHAIHNEQPCGNWVSSSQYHDYAPQLTCDKPPEPANITTQTNGQQMRALRVPSVYECSDGVYEYYKPETIPDNSAYPQSGLNTTITCDQTYRRGSSTSSSIPAQPMANDCPSRGVSEMSFMTGYVTKVNRSQDKLDSSRSESNTELPAMYQETSQIQTSVPQQQQQTAAEKDQHGGSRAGFSSVSTNRSQSSSDRLNQCRICGRNYARPSTLKTHLRTHTNERPYKCAVCRKTFSQAANLTAHQRVHTGERPFPCPICGRQFSQSSSVITHLRTHSGERPYRCAMCNRRFSDSSTLTKHCRIHSGEKPYQCDYCPMNFSQSGNLSRHLRLHLMGGLSKTTSTSAPANSDSAARNAGPDNVVCIDSSSLAANQRRHSTNLSNSSPESTLSPLI